MESILDDTLEGLLWDIGDYKKLGNTYFHRINAILFGGVIIKVILLILSKSLFSSDSQFYYFYNM